VNHNANQKILVYDYFIAHYWSDCACCYELYQTCPANAYSYGNTGDRIRFIILDNSVVALVTGYKYMYYFMYM